jgi:glycine cleavage system aminomethyltransferase T
MGAEMLELEGWSVPRVYSSSDEEMKNAVKGVGICDISHYGKVDVKGTEIDLFFDSNSSLGFTPKKPGQVQSIALQKTNPFGPLYSCRLTEDHVLLITRPFQHPSALDVKDDSLKFTEKVYFTNVSSTYGGFNLAGPSSQMVLKKLVQVDLSQQTSDGSFCVEAGLAEVRSIIVRRDINYSGARIESFDLYFGRDYSEYVWDALMKAGRQFGIAPFGIEAHDGFTGARP